MREENEKQNVAKQEQNVVVIDEQKKSNINIMEFENKIILMFITLIQNYESQKSTTPTKKLIKPLTFI